MYEKEFLKLAAVMLSCRWRVMGHLIDNDPYPHNSLEFTMLGMYDYIHEMRITLEEELKNNEHHYNERISAQRKEITRLSEENAEHWKVIAQYSKNSIANKKEIERLQCIIAQLPHSPKCPFVTKICNSTPRHAESEDCFYSCYDCSCPKSQARRRGSE